MLLPLGTLVRLKSGGPLMTVVEYPGAAEGKRLGKMVCAWHSDDGMPQRVAYPEIALEFLVTAEWAERAIETSKRLDKYFAKAKEEEETSTNGWVGPIVRGRTNEKPHGRSIPRAQSLRTFNA
jgi:uncharacterized protein YodC (DUF2158 family)